VRRTRRVLGVELVKGRRSFLGSREGLDQLVVELLLDVGVLTEELEDPELGRSAIETRVSEQPLASKGRSAGRTDEDVSAPAAMTNREKNQWMKG
jgi:hypothetical protein